MLLLIDDKSIYQPKFKFFRSQITVRKKRLVTVFFIIKHPKQTKTEYAYNKERLEILCTTKEFAMALRNNIVSHITAIYMAYELDGEKGVFNYLQKQSRIEEEKFHCNHWRPLFLNALSQNKEFCNGGFKYLLPYGENGYHLRNQKRKN